MRDPDALALEEARLLRAVREGAAATPAPGWHPLQLDLFDDVGLEQVAARPVKWWKRSPSMRRRLAERARRLYALYRATRPHLAIFVEERSR